MSKFKTGQTVLITHSDWPEVVPVGSLQEVQEAYFSGFLVAPYDSPDQYYFCDIEAEPATTANILRHWWKQMARFEKVFAWMAVIIVCMSVLTLMAPSAHAAYFAPPSSGTDGDGSLLWLGLIALIGGATYLISGERR